MQILHTVALIMGIITYAALTFMTCFSFSRLRHQADDLKAVRHVLIKVYAIVSALKLKDDFDTINQLRTTLHLLVEKENYTEAAKVKEYIERQEKAVEAGLKKFNETFGDTAEISVKPINI